MNKRKIAAQNVYNIFKSNMSLENNDEVDNDGQAGDDVNINEQVSVPWTSLKVDQIRSAYMLFVHPTDNNQSIKKAAMIEELLVAFMQRPEDLDIFVDDSDDENEN